MKKIIIIAVSPKAEGARCGYRFVLNDGDLKGFVADIDRERDWETGYLAGVMDGQPLKWVREVVIAPFNPFADPAPWESEQMQKQKIQVQVEALLNKADLCSAEYKVLVQDSPTTLPKLQTLEVGTWYLGINETNDPFAGRITTSVTMPIQYVGQGYFDGNDGTPNVFVDDCHYLKKGKSSPLTSTEIPV